MGKILKYFRSSLPLSNKWTIAFLFLVLIYILPIWIFKYFPSQDGPAHIYNSFILIPILVRNDIQSFCHSE